MAVNQWLDRHHAALRASALVLPLGWCALAGQIGAGVTTATSALVLVVIVVAASAGGDRLAGAVAALSGAAWFDFFLAPPIHTFAIDDANDVEIAVLLGVVGLAVTEIALWGRRQQSTSSARAGYLDGVTRTSQIIAGQMTPDELVGHVSAELTQLLDIDTCRFAPGAAATGHPVLELDGSVTVNGRRTNVDRDGLPTMDQTVLPARHHGAVLGHFLITASTRITRPGLEQRQVAVLLADLVGAELASRPRALRPSATRAIRD